MTTLLGPGQPGLVIEAERSSSAQENVFKRDLGKDVDQDVLEYIDEEEKKEFNQVREAAKRRIKERAAMLHDQIVEARAKHEPKERKPATKSGNLHFEVHQAPRLPRNLRREVHQVLRLPRSLHFEVHQVLRLPRNLRVEGHRMLCLPRNLRVKRHRMLHLPRNLRFEVHRCCACHDPGSQNAVPATKSAHRGSQNAVLATKSAHQGL